MIGAERCACTHLGHRFTAGYKDANDLNHLRHDPVMKITVGHCPASGEPLASQSTISKLENAPQGKGRSALVDPAVR
jgi:hypothetical protein